MTRSSASNESPAEASPLAGRVALVTGGGTGIGLAIARRLARDGALVAIAARDLARLRRAARAHAAAGRGEGGLHPYRIDVRRLDSVAAALRDIRRDLGRIHVVVANAGRSGVTPVRGGSEREFGEIVETNLLGAYRTVRESLRHLARTGPRRIVLVSSILGKIGVPGYSAYCASKHALIGLGRCLALELAPEGITVNTICPGWVDTEMAAAGIARMARDLRVAAEEAKRRALLEVPLGRFSTPEEVAELVCYVVSDAAAMMTGQTVDLNGGAAMH